MERLSAVAPGRESQVRSRLRAGGGSQVRTRLASFAGPDEFLESIKKGVETSDPRHLFQNLFYMTLMFLP